MSLHQKLHCQRAHRQKSADRCRSPLLLSGDVCPACWRPSGAAGWLHPVGGVASKQMTESRQHSFAILFQFLNCGAKLGFRQATPGLPCLHRHGRANQHRSTLKLSRCTEYMHRLQGSIGTQRFRAARCGPMASPYRAHLPSFCALCHAGTAARKAGFLVDES
jgi:hypothetical protein